MQITRGAIRVLVAEFAQLPREQLENMRRQLISAGGKRITSWTDIGISSSAYYELDSITQLAVIRKAILMQDGKYDPRPRPQHLHGTYFA